MRLRRLVGVRRGMAGRMGRMRRVRRWVRGVRRVRVRRAVVLRILLRGRGCSTRRTRAVPPTVAAVLVLLTAAAVPSDKQDEPVITNSKLLLRCLLRALGVVSRTIYNVPHTLGHQW